MRYLPHVVLYTGLALVVHSMLGCSGVQHLDVRGAPTFTLAEVRDPAAGPRVAAAMRRLFGLRGGTFQVGFGISKANGARITLALNAPP